MLRVKTELRSSPLHGLGCFSARAIARGEVVWRFDEGLDVVVEASALDSLPHTTREFLKVYGYALDGAIVLCGDHARHMNHSADPNVIEIDDGSNVAARDIAAGEELTCNYFEFDALAGAKLGG
ncbi:MAG: SET domain-containing protein [Acidobacteria bacterium]|nr:SET domain-containing protein [Acidobacteriota bacterium]